MKQPSVESPFWAPAWASNTSTSVAFFGFSAAKPRLDFFAAKATDRSEARSKRLPVLRRSGVAKLV